MARRGRPKKWKRQTDFYRWDIAPGWTAYIQYRSYGFWDWWIYRGDEEIEKGEAREPRSRPFSGLTEAHKEVDKAIRRLRENGAISVGTGRGRVGAALAAGQQG